VNAAATDGVKRPNFMRPVAPAPAAGPKHNPAGPPLKQGTAYVSSATANELRPFGYADGDPVPENLPQVIADIRARYAGAKQEVAAIGAKTRLGQVKTVALADLPPAAQQEITAFLQQARELKRQEAAIEAKIPANATPEVRAALESHLTGGVTVLDDDGEQSIETPPADAPADAPPAQVAAPPASHPVVCPQCNHDVRHEVLIPTDQDRMQFQAAMLDPLPTSRFYKEIPFFDGKMRVVYRTLTSNESLLVAAQLRRDAIAGRIAGEPEYYIQMMEYRRVLSVDKIFGENGVLLAENPPLTLPLPPEEAEQQLRVLIEFMNAEVYSKEPIQRLIGQYHRHFQRLVEAMEATARSADF